MMAMRQFFNLGFAFWRLFEKNRLVPGILRVHFSGRRPFWMPHNVLSATIKILQRFMPHNDISWWCQKCNLSRRALESVLPCSLLPLGTSLDVPNIVYNSITSILIPLMLLSMYYQQRSKFFRGSCHTTTSHGDVKNATFRGALLKAFCYAPCFLLGLP